MKKKYTKILQQIQSEIPKEYTQNIMKTVKRYEFMKELMQKGIDDPEFPEEKKTYYKNIIQSGQMDIEDEEVDEEITAKIDEFTNNRIREAIEKGNLPKYAFKHLFKKAKKENNKLNK